MSGGCGGGRVDTIAPWQRQAGGEDLLGGQPRESLFRGYEDEGVACKVIRDFFVAEEHLWAGDPLATGRGGGMAFR